MSNQKTRGRGGGGSGCLFNILTIFTLVGIFIVAGVYGYIFYDPEILPEQFQPLPNIPTVPVIPSMTATTEDSLPSTWTPLPVTPTSTLTPVPSSTPIPSATEVSIVDTPTPTNTIVPGQFQFQVREGEPIYLQNVTHAELGCNFLGVGGQVFDLTSAPIKSLVVHLSGTFDNKAVDLITLTGTALQYGPGGYEFTLGQAPLASDDDLYIELLSQAGAPITERVIFDTYADCERNLILLNFEEIGQ